MNELYMNVLTCSSFFLQGFVNSGYGVNGIAHVSTNSRIQKLSLEQHASVEILYSSVS